MQKYDKYLKRKTARDCNKLYAIKFLIDVKVEKIELYNYLKPEARNAIFPVRSTFDVVN